MKYAILVLTSTAVVAVAALIIAHLLGCREDVWCAIGGLIGFGLSNAVCRSYWRKSEQSDQRSCRAVQSSSISTIIAYFFLSMSCFALLGWLTGYLHYHGAKAGAISGGLSGVILAIAVPEFLGCRFLPLRKELVVFVVLVLSFSLAAVVWVMYFTDMKYWHELS